MERIRMHDLGHTRSGNRRDHFLLTPDTFVRAPLPGMRNATAIVHAAPAHGAGFTEYTVEFEPGWSMNIGFGQAFGYVVDGAVVAGDERLTAGQYAYFPPESGDRVESEEGARLVVIEKPFVALQALPGCFSGDERAIEPMLLL